jgi:hypothetical protein
LEHGNITHVRVLSGAGIQRSVNDNTHLPSRTGTYSMRNMGLHTDKE